MTLGYSKEHQARRGKPNKYKNVKTEYGGIHFRSGLEARYAQQLDWLKKAGEVKEWEYESARCSLKLEVKGILIAKYSIDFWVLMSDGTEKYVETKGAQTALWRIKWKLAKALYPELNFELVKKVR